jgi:hypothetical protein
VHRACPEPDLLRDDAAGTAGTQTEENEMSRRMFLPVAMGLVLLGSGVAMADANGSTEQEKVKRDCSAPADNRYSAPGPNDCKNGATTYTATYWSNNVKCGSANSPTPANPTGLRLYASQAGGVGTCSDGALPVQGRAGVSGGTNGAKVTIDGDRDNPKLNGNESLHGWATVEARPAAAPPTVRCGDEHSQGGRADSDSPQARDNQGECGG